MELNSLTDYFVFVDVGICLCCGFVIKTSLDFIKNKYIPLIMMILGLIVNILINYPILTAEIVLGGMISGLASTGLYESFRSIMNIKE